MIYLFLAFAFSLFVAVFAIQNSLPVTIGFLNWSFQTSLVIVILGAATFGALAILSLAVMIQLKGRWALKKAKQRTVELEAEVKALKAELEQEKAKDITKNDL